MRSVAAVSIDGPRIALRSRFAQVPKRLARRHTIPAPFLLEAGPTASATAPSAPAFRLLGQDNPVAAGARYARPAVRSAVAACQRSDAPSNRGLCRSAAIRRQPEYRWMPPSPAGRAAALADRSPECRDRGRVAAQREWLLGGCSGVTHSVGRTLPRPLSRAKIINLVASRLPRFPRTRNPCSTRPYRQATAAPTQRGHVV